jgi:nucleoside-diphosphate-sugar epimerase
MDLGKPILVTGASGKTGQRMVASIAKKGGTVRAFVRRPEAGDPLKQAGAAEIACTMIELAGELAVDRFVLYSVLLPCWRTCRITIVSCKGSARSSTLD